MLSRAIERLLMPDGSTLLLVCWIVSVGLQRFTTVLATLGSVELLSIPASSSWAAVVVVGPLIAATLSMPLGRAWLVVCCGVSVRAVLLVWADSRVACSTSGLLALTLLSVSPLALPLRLKLLGAWFRSRLSVSQLLPLLLVLPLVAAMVIASLPALL